MGSAVLLFLMGIIGNRRYDDVAAPSDDKIPTFLLPLHVFVIINGGQTKLKERAGNHRNHPGRVYRGEVSNLRD